MTIRTPASENPLRTSKERCERQSAGKLALTNIKVSGVEHNDTLYPNPVDITFLDTESLGRYLRSKGGRNDLAEDIVRSLLDHPPLARQD